MTNSWVIDEREFHSAKSIPEKLKFLLSYAVLAPSRYNSQPWKFIVHSNKIYVYADQSKRLNVIDPYERELYISLGAAIANLHIAAEHFDLAYKTIVCPESDDESLAAIIEFYPTYEFKSVYPAALFPYLTKRHTDRGLYLKKEIDKQTISDINGMLRNIADVYLLITGASNIKYIIAQLVKKSDIERGADVRYENEQKSWNLNMVDENSPFLKKLLDSTRDNLEKIVKFPLNHGHMQAIRDAKLIHSSPLVGILFTNDDTRKEWIHTGIAFEILSLALTSFGLSHCPMTSLIENIHSRNLLKSFTSHLKIPQMLIRIGYGTHATVTPRDPIDVCVTMFP